MKKLCFNPFFILGLLIRLALIVMVAPHAATDWYVPFLDITTAHLSFDPWAVWLKAGGAPAAFPYGYMMWIVFLPLRQKPMWQVMTHLNPTANDLEGFCHDLVSLADGKAIQSRHYDHQTGKMSRPLRIKSNDFIIASGLHVLYLPMLRECYNLKIYLDINEGLRRHFKLKRDVYQRGHTIEQVLASFEKREPDSARFIRPQSSYADLLLSLQPIHPWMLEKLDDQHPLRLQLVVKTRRGLNEFSLNRVLIGVCGLHIDMIKSENSEEIQMTIEGETSAADVAMAAEILCPQILEFLDIQPKWQDGMAGLMQLVTLSHINQALIKRFIQ